MIKVSNKAAITRGKVKKGEEYNAIDERTRKGVRRPAGTLIRIAGNAALLLNTQQQPHSTRLIGPEPRELRTEQYMKIESLAPEVL